MSTQIPTASPTITQGKFALTIVAPVLVVFVLILFHVLLCICRSKAGSGQSYLNQQQIIETYAKLVTNQNDPAIQRINALKKLSVDPQRRTQST